MRLENKIAVITGAGSGIGAAMARRFIDEGAKVLGVDLSAQGLASTAAGLRPDRFQAQVANIATLAGIDTVVAATVEQFGKIDVLVNNAGIWDDHCPFLETSEELWDCVFDVNLKSMFRLCQRLLPLILEGGGSIVNVASIAGQLAGGGGAAYTASKHAVIGLTRQLAFEFGPRNVRVNAISPGGVETGMNRDVIHTEKVAVMYRDTPAARHGQPIEIANLALYLASDEAAFAHGGVFTLDGGWSIR